LIPQSPSNKEKHRKWREMGQRGREETSKEKEKKRRRRRRKKKKDFE